MWSTWTDVWAYVAISFFAYYVVQLYVNSRDRKALAKAEWDASYWKGHAEKLTYNLDKVLRVTSGLYSDLGLAPTYKEAFGLELHELFGISKEGMDQILRDLATKSDSNLRDLATKTYSKSVK